RAALGLLLERHRPRLFATAVRLVGGYRSDAEDAVQETCLAAIRHIGSVRDPEWGALQRLPEPLRVSAMLRYFGSYDSYDEVATDPRRPDRNGAKPAVRSKDQACRGAARERRAHRRRSR
ncbi:MAG TPA: sigma factor, partial [Gemmatimonadaceae bacterium]